MLFIFSRLLKQILKACGFWWESLPAAGRGFWDVWDRFLDIFFWIGCRVWYGLVIDFGFWPKVGKTSSVCCVLWPSLQLVAFFGVSQLWFFVLVGV